VREIDELQDSEDKRVAERDQGVERSDGNSVGQRLHECLERMIHAALGT
jgi:hypothetical protein